MKRLGPLLVALSVTAASAALGQESEEPPARSADEIARELSNPVSLVGSMVFQLNYQGLDGSLPDASSQSSTSVTFLPTLPFKLGSGNLVVRPSFPVIGIPRYDAVAETWSKDRVFGDMGLMALWGRTESSGLIWSIGATSIFPTAGKDLSQKQVQLGPAAILGIIKKWGVLGVLWQHWWGLSEPDDRLRANSGSVQIFYWFGLGNGWQIGGSPVASANYLNRNENRFTFPLNLGVAKTFILGDMPLKTTLQGQYFMTRPDESGPSWGVFFQITPVVKLPWG